MQIFRQKCLLTSSFVTLGLLLASCNFRDEKNQGSTPSPVADSQLSFAEVTSTVFAPSCLSCHSSSGGKLGGVNLETYDDAKSRLADIDAVVFETKSMPPSGGLSTTARSLLRAWIDAGAPETTVTP